MPLRSFVYDGFPSRVIFAVGSIAQLPSELERLDAKRALVLSTSGQSDTVRRVAASLGTRAAGVFDKAAMHVPVEIAEEARRVARELDADCCVTVGGGSVTGLGKAIALTSALPILAVPTTYAGSEMTTIYGITAAEEKMTGRDVRVLPKAVVYDPQLTVRLPRTLSATSGMNAIAHAVEALYSHDGNPIISLMAEEGIRALAVALPRISADPTDLDARSDALYGAWLCGVALNGAGMALHHKLCHVLGGSFNLPHAETHSIVLPHAIRYNRDAAPEAMRRITRAIQAEDASQGIYDLQASLGTPMRLSEIGMNRADLERAARIASATPYPNPSKVEYEAVLALLRDAYDGRRPSA